jgi:transglutaminase-like putative cysteine protease
VSRKDFSQAFATAAEVAESREGDCTEHAVLLAALLRACGIASRVAIGLVYVESAAGFGYHMWSEAYLDGQWIPLDGILGQGGTSAAYLKLTDSSLEGASSYSSFLPVAQVVGQLKISIRESEP